MGKIIVITNQKGGVGKTTTSVNLAAGLGIENKKVLLVDIDPQGNATQGIGIDKTKCHSKNSYNLIVKRDNPEKYIHTSKWKNVDVIAGTQDMAGLDRAIENEVDNQIMLRNSLEKVREKYDYILIDCPPALNLITLNGICAADSVLVPVQCEFYALEGITQLLNTVKSVKTHSNKKLVFEGFLGTMYQTGTSLSQQVYTELEKYFERNLFKTYIRRNVALAEAPSHSQPIMYYDKNTNGAHDYMNLAREVISNNE